MPPAISDDERSDASGEGRAASKRARKAVTYSEPDIEEPMIRNGDTVEDDDEELELGEDEYVVEKILTHMVDENGTLRFKVKWEGFEKKSDQTWEPEENLSGSPAILNEYYESIGGREMLYEDTAKALHGKKRGRTSVGKSPAASAKRTKRNGEHPASSEPPASLPRKTFMPPAGSWENDVTIIDMYRDESGSLMVYLTWKNSEKTQHPARMAYARCPQKMLQYYESKIHFTIDPPAEPTQAKTP